LRGKIVPLPLFWQHTPAARHFADAPSGRSNNDR